MSMAYSLVFSNPSSFHQPSSSLLHRSPQALVTGHRRILQISTLTTKARNRLLIRRAMESSGGNGEVSSKEVPKVTNSSNGLVPSGGGPGLPIPNIPAWAKWALGSILCLALPFYKRVLRIEDGVEKAAETVVEAVEKVAEVAGKVAGDIAGALPTNSKLKQEVMEVEQFADELDKDLEKAGEFIHKVDLITDEVEKLVDPVIEEGEKIEEETQDTEKKIEKETQDTEKKDVVQSSDS